MAGIPGAPGRFSLRLLTAHTRLGHYPSRRGLPFLLEDRDSARRTCYCLLGTLVTVSRQGARSRGGREDLVCVNWSKALSSPSYLVTRRAELRGCEKLSISVQVAYASAR